MVYNHEPFIRECLEGFLMQKCNFDYEIVLGEDCSTDNSREIILEYANKFPEKFKLFLHVKNVGAAQNQKIVFENCTGKYIAMCEGDDYWTDPYKLQKQVDLLESNLNLSGCFCNSKYVDFKGQFLGNSDRVPENMKEIYFEDMAQKMLAHTPALMMRGVYLDQLFVSSLHLYPYGDIPIMLHCLTFGPFAYINEPMAVYRRNVGITKEWSNNYHQKGKVDLLILFKRNHILNLRKRLAINLCISYNSIKLSKNLALEGNIIAFKYYAYFFFFNLSRLFFNGRVCNNFDFRDYLRPIIYYFSSSIHKRKGN